MNLILLLHWQASSLLPSNRNRSFLVYSLIHAYGLLTTCTDQTSRRFVVVQPRPAGEKELLAYHTHDYLEYAMSQSSDARNLLVASEFGLEDVRSISNLSSGCFTLIRTAQCSMESNTTSHKSRELP